MGILTRLAESRASKIPGVAVGSENSWLRGIFNFNDSASGISVDEFNALNVTAVFACVRILAESVASLPLPVYRYLQGGGKERAIDHYLYPVLHDQPNPEMSSFELRETLMGHVLLWGNAYAEIVRNGAGQVAELWPLRPDRMFIWRDPETRKLQYIYSVKSSFDLTLAPQKVVLDPSQVLHIRGIGYDGIRGYSPVTLNKEAVGLALATQEYGARLFGNGARPSGILSANKPLNSEAKKNLREDWNQVYGGLQNAHRVAVLEEGVTWQAVGIPPEDAQFLATRTFQLNEIARMFRVPPHLLQELTRSTNNNIEHQGMDYVTHSVRPWTVRWEQAFQRSLFLPSERQSVFAEFLLDGLLRGDMLTRYQAYAIGRQWGFLNANEIRDKENLNPVDPEDGDGDEYWKPVNMAAGDMVIVDPNATNPNATNPDEPGGADGGADDAPDGGQGNDTARALRPLVEDVLRRCIRRERADVMRQAAKLLSRDDRAGFDAWLETFYADHDQFTQRALEPVLQSLQAVGRQASGIALPRTPAGADLTALDAHYDRLEADEPSRIAALLLGLS